MRFLTDEFPNEHKKMGGELEETVKEIIEKIKQMENDYDKLVSIHGKENMREKRHEGRILNIYYSLQTVDN